MSAAGRCFVWTLSALWLLGLGGTAAVADDLAAPLQRAAQPAYIAIVIDDLGYDASDAGRAAALPGAVTLSILPFSPHGRDAALLARRSGKEIMLHAPMEPENGVRWEPRGLSTRLSRSGLRTRLRAMLEALPEAVGLNNHMGSKLTQNTPAMTWLMAELKRRHLYFVDSRTTAATQAGRVARDLAVPNADRDVFLDNERETKAIEARFDTLVLLARKRGAALAIAHPYIETLAVLERRLPYLAEQGVTLVPVSVLIAHSDAVDAGVLASNKEIKRQIGHGSH